MKLSNLFAAVEVMLVVFVGFGCLILFEKVFLYKTMCVDPGEPMLWRTTGQKVYYILGGFGQGNSLLTRELKQQQWTIC